jgi:hypothetical protein
MRKDCEKVTISECPICGASKTVEWISKQTMDLMPDLQPCDSNETFICMKAFNKHGNELNYAREKRFNGYFTKPKENE